MDADNVDADALRMPVWINRKGVLRDDEITRAGRGRRSSTLQFPAAVLLFS